MELSLKAARKLEGKVNTLLNETPLKTTVKVRVTSSLEEAKSLLATEQKKFSEASNKRFGLMEVVSEIRTQIAKANQTSGVSDLLAEKVSFERQLSEVNELLSSEESPDETILKDTLDLAKSQMSSHNSYRNSNPLFTEVSVLSKGELDFLKRRRQFLKEDIENIEDELQKLNYTVKIRLSEDSVNILKESDLVR